MIALFNSIVNWLENSFERPEDMAPDIDIDTDYAPALMRNMRIGQEGGWLVLRSANPLENFEVKDCAFYQMGEPDVGVDEIGGYIRWPLINCTL
jgi:hypothetical protein